MDKKGKIFILTCSFICVVLWGSTVARDFSNNTIDYLHILCLIAWIANAMTWLLSFYKSKRDE